MKNFRLPAATAVVALGISASIAMAIPASAEDFYVVDSDLSTEGASYPSYPDGQWFTGNPQPATAPETTEEGLVLTGQTQLLYGAAEAPITGESFTDLVTSAGVDADGTWAFQVPIFFDGETPYYFTTLRPADFSDLSGDWLSSQSIEGFDANTPYPLEEWADLIDSAISVGLEPVLLAFGVFVDPGDTATLASVTWDGDTFFFTAEEELEVEPTPSVEPEPEEEEAAPATAVEAEATFTG